MGRREIILNNKNVQYEQFILNFLCWRRPVIISGKPMHLDGLHVNQSFGMAIAK